MDRFHAGHAACIADASPAVRGGVVWQTGIDRAMEVDRLHWSFVIWLSVVSPDVGISSGKAGENAKSILGDVGVRIDVPAYLLYFRQDGLSWDTFQPLPSFRGRIQFVLGPKARKEASRWERQLIGVIENGCL